MMIHRSKPLVSSTGRSRQTPAAGVILLSVALFGMTWRPAFAADCTYSFTLPRGGETWRQGTGQTISWSRLGTCSTRVYLDLLRDGEQVLSITSSADNSGSYRWTVPSSADPGRDYAIRIRDRDDYDSYDVSNSFTITDTSGCTIEVVEPIAGQTLYKEEEITVRWDRTGSCGSRVRLDLYRTGGYVLEISGDEANSGEWTGMIPGEFATGADFRIKVTDLGTTTIYDYSDPFRVAPARPCSFDITSPADEDTWYLGETHTILWSSSGACSSNVAIALLRADEEIESLTNRTSDSGEYEWTVSSGLPSGDDYRIRIRDTDDSESVGMSDPFSIVDDSGPAHIYWIDNVARLNGAAGSVWRSDIVLFNRGEHDAEVELWLFTTTGAQVLESTVRAGTQGVFEDVVGMMDLEDKGCLGIGSTEPLEVSGRIYNETDDGTFGQFLSGWDDGEGLETGDSGRLLQLRQTSGQFRTNLTVANSGAEAAEVRITLFDSAGNELHAYTLTVGPRRLKQDLEPFKNRAGRPNLGWGYAEIEVTAGAGVLVSASVIDSRTNDPTTVPVIPQG